MTISNVPAAQQSSGRWLEATPGERFYFHVSSEETAGVYMMFEVVDDPRNSVPIARSCALQERFRLAI
jgi:hypothetical protein